MISVIVPVLNEAEVIESTLERLRELEGSFEVLVVDGGSTDGTVERARHHARVLAGERGRALQMNLGARAAKGHILLFLHADTWLPRRALAEVERTLSDGGVVGGRFRIRLDSPRLAFRLIELAINLRDRFFGGFTGDQAIFIRADAFWKLDGYRSSPLMEDLDLAMRMTKLGRTVRLSLAAHTSARRWEKDGVLRTIALMWALRFSYLAGASPAFLSKFYGNTR